MGNEPIITAHGQATLTVAPDLATLWWTASTDTATAEDAKAAVAKHLAMAQSVLAEHEVAIESTSEQIHIGPRIRWRRVRSINDGYVGQCHVTITMHGFESLANLVSDLLSIPDSSLSGPSWSLRPNSAAHRKARIAAIRDAQSVAVDYASAFGVQVERLVEVSDQPGFGGGPMMAMRMGGAGGEEDFDLQLTPEVQEVRAEVTVRFLVGTPTQDSLRNPVAAADADRVASPWQS